MKMNGESGSLVSNLRYYSKYFFVATEENKVNVILSGFWDEVRTPEATKTVN
jgi:hypothetical protein